MKNISKKMYIGIPMYIIIIVNWIDKHIASDSLSLDLIFLTFMFFLFYGLFGFFLFFTPKALIYIFQKERYINKQTIQWLKKYIRHTKVKKLLSK